MAEMTAAEHAIQVLKSSIQYNNDADPDDCRLALQVIEQQAATITELQTEIEYQNKQIARLQKDLSKWQVKDGQNDVQA